MTIIEAEKNLALYLAGLLNAEPDRKIFSGSFPEAVNEGIAVNFERGTPASFDGTNSYNAVVRGRFRTRTECRNAVDIIAAKIPVFGAMDLISIKSGTDPQVRFPENCSKDPDIFEFELQLKVSYI